MEHPNVPQDTVSTSVIAQPHSPSPAEQTEKVNIVVPTDDSAEKHTGSDPNTAAPGETEHPITDTALDATPAGVNASPKTEDNSVGNTPGRAYHRLNLDLETDFWEEYVNQADALDREMVKTLSEDLNTLLIFVSSLSSALAHI